MAYKLYSKETIVDEEEISTWYLDKEDGTIIMNIEKLFGGGVTDCDWIDKDQNKFISFMHSDEMGGEVWGILNVKGNIIIQDLRCIDAYIDESQCFVVEVTGITLGLTSRYYSLDEYDWKMAVVDRNGNFIIEPYYNVISYYSDEKIYIADNKEKFDLKGEKIIPLSSN